MRRILKQILAVNDIIEQSSIVHLPKECELLEIVSQSPEFITIFFEVDVNLERNTEPIAFRLFKTGQVVAPNYTFVATITQFGEYHLYEEDIPKDNIEVVSVHFPTESVIHA